MAKSNLTRRCASWSSETRRAPSKQLVPSWKAASRHSAQAIELVDAEGPRLALDGERAQLVRGDVRGHLHKGSGTQRDLVGGGVGLQALRQVDGVADGGVVLQ